MSDYETEIMRRLNADPTIRALFAPPKQPRYRYFQTPDGTMFIWTTEKMGDGKYASAIYQPTGEGSRSGKAKVTEWKPVREVRHATRVAAKARALKLWRDHNTAHPEWVAADQARRERAQAAFNKRQADLRLRWFSRTGTWRPEWGPTPEGN